MEIQQNFVPYLMVKNAKLAIEFYADVFNGEVGDISYGDKIPELKNKEEAKNIIIHSQVFFKNKNNTFKYVLHFADSNYNEGGFSNKTIQGNNIQLSYDFEGDKDFQLKVFNKLKEEGTVIIDLKQQLLGAIYGTVVDKFGITWQLNCLNKQ
jgi:PhnB protein